MADQATENKVPHVNPYRTRLSVKIEAQKKEETFNSRNIVVQKIILAANALDDLLRNKVPAGLNAAYQATKKFVKTNSRSIVKSLDSLYTRCANWIKNVWGNASEAKEPEAKEAKGAKKQATAKKDHAAQKKATASKSYNLRSKSNVVTHNFGRATPSSSSSSSAPAAQVETAVRRSPRNNH